jgi:hypothetical protein
LGFSLSSGGYLNRYKTPFTAPEAHDAPSPTDGRRSLDEREPQKTVEGMTRIVLRPLASPLPPAFFAFGAGSLMLSGLQLGMMPASDTRGVALVQAALVFPPLALSSALAFLYRASEGDLGEQVGPVEPEAGVRKQL